MPRKTQSTWMLVFDGLLIIAAFVAAFIYSLQEAWGPATFFLVAAVALRQHSRGQADA